MTTSGGSFGAISKPVLSAGASSGGSLNAGSARDVPLAVISGVRRHRQLGRADRLGEVAAAVERVLDLVDEVLDRGLALVGVELGGDFGRACSSVLPPPALTESTFTTTQPKSDWTGPTTAPVAAAKTAAAALSPATPA